MSKIDGLSLDEFGKNVFIIRIYLEILKKSLYLCVVTVNILHKLYFINYLYFMITLYDFWLCIIDPESSNEH